MKENPLSNDNDHKNQKYVCINCGIPLDVLYKKYTPTILKIMNCNQCNGIADKYIEFEPIIIILDLILLERPVYRHVLYNTTFNIRWKLAVVLLLLETYILTKDRQKNPITQQYLYNVSSENEFYFCFFLTFIDKILLLVLIRLFLLVIQYFKKFTNKTPPPQSSNIGGTVVPESTVCLNYLSKAIILASITKFFFIPVVIWYRNTTEFGIMLHLIVITGYYMLALTYILSVISQCRRTTIGVIVVIVMIVKGIIFHEIVGIMEDFVYFNK